MNKIDFNRINKDLGERIEDLLIALQVDLYEYGNGYCGTCPIHGGDNPSSFKLNGVEHEFPLRYTCWSHSCQDHWGRNLIGFVRGILSHQNNLWCAPGDDELPWSEFFEWTRNFLGDTVPKNQIIKREPSEYIEETLWTEFEYRKQFSVPSRYYLKRGFSEKILSEYLIADSNQYGPLYKRAIIPLIKGRNIVGISSRSMLSECPLCKCHHEGQCPDEKNRHYPSYVRWAHRGFKKSKILYNLDRELDWIRQEGTAIVVESPGSTWRLVESQIPGVVCTFGCKMSQGQLEILANNNVNKIILLMDNDNAGISSSRSIAEKYKRDFQFIIPPLEMKEGMDLADYPTEIVKRTLNIKLKRIGYPL